jgi:hypothetical protein
VEDVERDEIADRIEVHIGTPIPICQAENERRLSVNDTTSDTSSTDTAATSTDSTSKSRTEPYPPATFENLVYRYEEPNGMARWDSPLFTVVRDDEQPPCEAIWDAMIGSDGKGRVVRSNAATVLVCPQTDLPQRNEHTTRMGRVLTILFRNRRHLKMPCTPSTRRRRKSCRRLRRGKRTTRAKTGVKYPFRMLMRRYNYQSRR